MSAVPAARAVPVPAHLGDRLRWLAPAPLWQEETDGAASLSRPWIAELATDDFVEDFLATLGGTGGRQPSDLALTRPAVTVAGEGEVLRLFQPLSRRYYLVCATLACSRPGIPDHRPAPAAGERAFFVLRRLTDDGECGQVGRDWHPVAPDALLPGETEHPMHPAPVAGFAAPGTVAAGLGMAAGQESTRQVLHGYVPVAGRDALVPPIADPAQALLDVQEQMPLPSPPESPALDELITRVVAPWRSLAAAPTVPSSPNIGYASLFLLLDLLDWLGTHLDVVRDRVVDGTAIPAARPAAQQLYDGLEGVTVPVTGPAGLLLLPEALSEVDGVLDLVHGADIPPPARGFDLRAATRPATWLSAATEATSLAGLARAALTESGTAPVVPPELIGLIKADPVPADAGGTPVQGSHVIRCVLAREPCSPVLSSPTQPFQLARAMDADAPARPVLLQLPDVDHLRRFDRGVAIEMPPSLRRLLDRVTPGMLKGDGLDPDPGLQLGMICSFSLQIIFLVAFVVMFIFLLLLNIVFWWMPFLKICFPVPVKPATPKGPTP